MPTALFTPSTPLEHRLTATLWSFTSSYWRGFVDFREPGNYWTHWGFGTWRSLGAQRITMRNGYDPFFFTLEFDDALESFVCIDSNHPTRPVGVALYAYARDEVLRTSPCRFAQEAQRSAGRGRVAQSFPWNVVCFGP